MKTFVLSALGCVLLSSAVCFTIWNVLAAGERPAFDEIAGDLAAVKERLERLERDQKSAHERADNLGEEISRLASAMVRARESRASHGDVTDGVATTRGDGGVVEDEDDTREGRAGTDIDLDETLSALADREVSHSEKDRLWSAVGKAGRMDEAVAFFETRARENPEDPDAQFELGYAYVQKLLTVDDVEKLRWAQRADASFDAALALDDHHWSARFSKAMSYAFSPPVLGLGPRAVEQLEILRAQQEESAPERHHAQTYQILGNLYANQGKAEKAREVWARGAAIFPEHAELQKAARRDAPAGE